MLYDFKHEYVIKKIIQLIKSAKAMLTNHKAKYITKRKLKMEVQRENITRNNIEQYLPFI